MNMPPPYARSPQLHTPHGMFSRLGGLSEGPFASLNLSYSVGDDSNVVRENRQRLRQALGFNRLVAIKQEHGKQVLLVDEVAATAGGADQGYDAMICALPGVALLIQQADCQAVLLHAPSEGVVAAIHCGWRGSVCAIILHTIALMRQHFQVDPTTLEAAISPSLGPCCAQFIHFKQELPAWMHAYQPRPAYFDFWEISRQQLQHAGLSRERIHVSGICTRCNRQYFSYRRAMAEQGGITGRNGSAIGLAAD